MNHTSNAVPDAFPQAKNSAQKPSYIVRSSRTFMRVTLALFSAGLATFALLYCVQPILPILSHEFDISPAQSSMSLSISTGMLAVGLLFTGPISDAVGRKPVMVTALVLAAIFTLLSTLTTSWNAILLMRALTGLALSGVAAVGMTYLSEEMHPGIVAFAMGLYISGNSIGGMSGRLKRNSHRLCQLARRVRRYRRLCAGIVFNVLENIAPFAPFSPRFIKTAYFAY